MLKTLGLILYQPKYIQELLPPKVLGCGFGISKEKIKGQKEIDGDAILNITKEKGARFLTREEPHAKYTLFL